MKSVSIGHMLVNWVSFQKTQLPVSWTQTQMRGFGENSFMQGTYTEGIKPLTINNKYEIHTNVSDIVKY